MADKEPRSKDAEGVASDATLPALNTPSPVRTPSGSGGRGGGTPNYQSGDLVAERYKIIKPIGEGGMGEVYEAEDLLLKERVALKTLRETVIDDETSVLRFKREIQLARKVTHPNVCRIFDVGLDRRAGVGRESAFLTMELLGGETLAARIRRQGPLSTAEALPIASQIAAALGAAHAAGIIHRDLKCANVVLEDGGRAVVTDFGLARAAAEGSDQVTGDGGIVGSPAYMAPEQVEGGRKLSGAADIYAFGVVLFEMVTGRLPFVGETPLATAVKRVKEPPPSPRKYVAGLDERWERGILHALGRTPEERPATALDVIAELRGDSIIQTPPGALTGTPVLVGQAPPPRRRRMRWVGVTVAVVAVGIWAANRHERRAAAPQSDKEEEGTVTVDLPPAPPGVPSWPSNIKIPKVPRFVFRSPDGKVVTEELRGVRRGVAILGFKNLGNKKDDDYLSTAFAEMLSSELMAGGELRTVPGESIARAKKQLDLVAADSYARDTLARLRTLLDADYVISGSYLVIGGERVRLDLKLQDTITGETVASIGEAGDLDELTDLVGEVGEKLRGELHVDEPSERERQGARALQPRKSDVTRLYAEGLAQMRVDNCGAARGPLEQAVAADPSYAQAHEALAEVLYCLGYEGRALEEAQRAVELSANLPEDVQLQAQARVQQLTNEHAKATASYEELFQRNPDNFDYGLRLVKMLAKEDKDKARATLAQLKKMKPSAEASAEIAMTEAQLMDDQPIDKQLAVLDKARQQAESQGARLLAAAAWLQEAYLHMDAGRLDEALATAQKAKEIYQASGDKDGVIWSIGTEAVIRKKRGDEKGSARLVDEATELAQQIDSVRSLARMEVQLAFVYADQGKLDEAEQLFNDVSKLFAKRGARVDAAVPMIWISWIRMYRGDLRRAQAIAERAGQELGEANADEQQAMATFVRAVMALYQGDTGAAHELYQEAARLNPKLEEWGGEAIVEAGIALLEDRAADAEAALRKLRDADPSKKLWIPPGESDRLLVESLLAQGKIADGRAILDRLRERRGKAPSMLVELEGGILAARLKAASRKPADQAAALRDLAAISERADGAGVLLTRMRADLARGKIEKASGNAAGARTLLGSVARDGGRRGFIHMAKAAAAALSDDVKTL